LRLKILADESVDFRIVTNLMNEGFEVISVLKEYQGIQDREVLELAHRFEALLLTEDKDFGEWVFAHKFRQTSVIFLRYYASEIEHIRRSVIKVLREHNVSLYGKFVVVTVKKIRIREIL